MWSLPSRSFLVRVIQWRLRSPKGGVRSFRARPPEDLAQAASPRQFDISSLGKWGNTVPIFQS